MLLLVCGALALPIDQQIRVHHEEYCSQSATEAVCTERTCVWASGACGTGAPPISVVNLAQVQKETYCASSEAPEVCAERGCVWESLGEHSGCGAKTSSMPKDIVALMVQLKQDVATDTAAVENLANTADTPDLTGVPAQLKAIAAEVAENTDVVENVMRADPPNAHTTDVAEVDDEPSVVGLL